MLKLLLRLELEDALEDAAAVTTTACGGEGAAATAAVQISRRDRNGANRRTAARPQSRTWAPTKPRARWGNGGGSEGWWRSDIFFANEIVQYFLKNFHF